MIRRAVRCGHGNRAGRVRLAGDDLPAVRPIAIDGDHRHLATALDRFRTGKGERADEFVGVVARGHPRGEFAVAGERHGGEDGNDRHRDHQLEQGEPVRVPAVRGQASAS